MRKCLFLLLFSTLSVACSNDDYVDVIPGESIVLLSIDGNQVGDEHSDGRILQALLRAEGQRETGLDFSSKVYLFETSDGTFGLCAKVGSKKTLAKFLKEQFASKRRCTELTERKGYQFTILDERWQIGFSSDALLVMGPTIKGSAEQSQLQLRMAKYLDAGREAGIRNTNIYERIDGQEAPVSMVARMDAFPEAVAMPLMMGVPKGADASQVWLSAGLTTADGCVEIAGDVFSFNEKINDGLQESFRSLRPITDQFVGKMREDALLGLFLNGKGTSLLPMFQANKGLQVLLTGMNTAIDMDNILRSVDGDMAAIVSGYENEKPLLGILAQLAHTDWLKDIDYWKRSCPAGTVIRDRGAQAFCLDLNTGAPGSNIFPFGVADQLVFYGGRFLQDEPQAEGVPNVKNGLPSSLRSKIIGQKLALVFRLNALKSLAGAEMFSTIESVIKPLFGDVTTIIYTLR